MKSELRRTQRRAFAAVALAAALPALAQTASVTARLTADNVYGLYFGTPASLTLAGTDATWGNAEVYGFSAGIGQFAFVAAWDLGGPQAWQGSLAVAGGATIRTNPVDWVYTTVQIAALPGWSSSGTALPSLGSLQTALASASWLPVAASASNSAAPWGSVVPDAGAQWIWGDTLADSSATDGRLVVFRTQDTLVSAIPESGTSLLMLAGLAAVSLLARRRRRP